MSLPHILVLPLLLSGTLVHGGSPLPDGRCRDKGGDAGSGEYVSISYIIMDSSEAKEYDNK